MFLRFFNRFESVEIFLYQSCLKFDYKLAYEIRGSPQAGAPLMRRKNFKIYPLSPKHFDIEIYTKTKNFFLKPPKKNAKIFFN
jgi:hypothetical protein